VLTEKGYRKKCKRFDNEGYAHFLTFSCFCNQPFLSRERTCKWLVASIGRAQSKGLFDLWAWVIMPEYVHLMILPHAEISKILTAIKSPVAKSAGLWTKSNAPEFMTRMLDVQPNGKSVIRFWQRGGGYDRNIRMTELLEKIRYMHKNPVRRGLTELPEHWLWSSANSWQNGVDEFLKIDRESLPHF
jgi:putative transposase